LAGVEPADLRRIVTTSFQQRRKTVRNSLKKLAKELCDGDAERTQALLDSPPVPLPAVIQNAKEEGDYFASRQQLPDDWATKRPEELSPGQFVELTRLFFGPATYNEGDKTETLGVKIWRKLKHGKLT
jgi:16S rRNA A1518/A1519 N6-dimethyltransferase RsmA/KsgA/DIM1 with predicted DNA glycosylase/AP lyase activity